MSHSLYRFKFPDKSLGRFVKEYTVAGHIRGYSADKHIKNATETGIVGIIFEPFTEILMQGQRIYIIL
jgi:hypothetical protein